MSIKKTGVQILWGMPSAKSAAALVGLGTGGEGIVTNFSEEPQGKTDTIAQNGLIVTRIDHEESKSYSADVIAIAFTDLPAKGDPLTISGFTGVTICDGSAVKYTDGQQTTIAVKFTNYPDMVAS